MISFTRKIENEAGKMVLYGDLDYGCIECAGVVFRRSRELLKQLEGEDTDSPTPADDEMIIEQVFDGSGKLIGQVAMTYLQKQEIWDFMTPQQKRLQARPVKLNQRTTTEINGVQYDCAIPGKSYAAKETAKNIIRTMSNNKVMVKNGFRKPKKK